MPLIVRELGRLKVEGAVLDGEVVVLDAEGQSSFAKLQAAFDEGASHPMTDFASICCTSMGITFAMSRLPSVRGSWSRCSIA